MTSEKQTQSSILKAAKGIQEKLQDAPQESQERAELLSQFRKHALQLYKPRITENLIRNGVGQDDEDVIAITREMELLNPLLDKALERKHRTMFSLYNERMKNVRASRQRYYACTGVEQQQVLKEYKELPLPADTNTFLSLEYKTSPLQMKQALVTAYDKSTSIRRIKEIVASESRLGITLWMALINLKHCIKKFEIQEWDVVSFVEHLKDQIICKMSSEYSDPERSKDAECTALLIIAMLEAVAKMIARIIDFAEKNATSEDSTTVTVPHNSLPREWQQLKKERYREFQLKILQKIETLKELDQLHGMKELDLRDDEVKTIGATLIRQQQGKKQHFSKISEEALQGVQQPCLKEVVLEHYEEMLSQCKERSILRYQIKKAAISEELKDVARKLLANWGSKK